MRTVLALIMFCLPFTATASSLQVGEPLPPLAITEGGELLLAGDEFSFSAWQAPARTGQIQVLQYLAARSNARDESKPFTDRLEQDLPEGSVHVTTVINLDDAIWGTSGFVVSEIKSSKRKYPKSTMVLDEGGLGLQHWQLQPGGANIVILDANGTVQYFKHGAMSAEEIANTLELIRGQLAATGA